MADKFENINRADVGTEPLGSLFDLSSARTLKQLLGPTAVVFASEAGGGIHLTATGTRGRLRCEGTELCTNFARLLGRGEPAVLDPAGSATLRAAFSLWAAPAPDAASAPAAAMAAQPVAPAGAVVTDPAAASAALPRDGESPRAWLDRVAPGHHLAPASLSPAFARLYALLDELDASAAAGEPTGEAAS